MAAWNPSDKSASITLSGSNTIATSTPSTPGGVRADKGQSAGRLYFEIRVQGFWNTWTYIGAVTAADDLINPTSNTALLLGFINGGAVSALDITFGFKYDFASGLMSFTMDGNSWYSSDVTFTNALFPYFKSGAYSSASIGTINLGDSAFTYGVPVGYQAWNTALVSDPTSIDVTRMSGSDPMVEPLIHTVDPSAHSIRDILLSSTILHDVQIPFTLQASFNDASNLFAQSNLPRTLQASFIDESTLNATPTVGHTYWRILIAFNRGGSYTTIQELYFKDAAGNDLCAGGTASASAYTNSTEQPAYAFDRTAGTRWAMNAQKGWLAYQFATPVIVDQVAIQADSRSAYSDSFSPEHFAVQYSDDGANWYSTQVVINQTGWAASETRNWAIPSIAPDAPHWLLHVISTQVTNNPTISEIEYHATVGGANIATGGTATAIDQYSSGWQASYAFDQNTSTSWSGAHGPSSWINYQFGSSVSCREIMIQADGTYYDYAPTLFDVAYSQDGYNYRVALSHATSTTWTSLSQQTFEIPAQGVLLQSSFIDESLLTAAPTISPPLDLSASILDETNLYANLFSPSNMQASFLDESLLAVTIQIELPLQASFIDESLFTALTYQLSNLYGQFVDESVLANTIELFPIPQASFTDDNGLTATLNTGAFLQASFVDETDLYIEVPRCFSRIGALDVIISG